MRGSWDGTFLQTLLVGSGSSNLNKVMSAFILTLPLGVKGLPVAGFCRPK